MKQVLFVNACMRGRELSRTWQLCHAFLQEYTRLHPDCRVAERDLTAGELPQLTGPMAARRDRWMREGEDHPLLAPAREMAGADLVVVGAPYWDLTFPAALKVYLEWCSVLGVTFRYTPEGQQVGMARAGHLVFLTTAGGPLEGANYGFDYLKALGAMFGIPNAHCVAAQGLDVQGGDPAAILAGARQRAVELAAALGE